MKKLTVAILTLALLLSGCGGLNDQMTDPTGETTSSDVQVVMPHPELVAAVTEEIPYVSQFDGETLIVLSDTGISVDGLAVAEDTAADGGVYISHDIIYYEDRDTYESGYPYGEGGDGDKHTADEAAAHTVVNITQPGAYRVTGQLSAGQIRIDLGESASSDPDAVVELILEDADITCTVAPAILFLNVYECDGDWSAETATSQVDTSDAGANLILEGQNTVSGSYVAKIYKDKEGEKKLYKQDGAIYSYMSMNVYGPGSLALTAANEGLDTQLHLTINGGNIAIRSDNDGINTNEDGVSVTTINAGTLHIIAGLGEEGDGIDSNGYLVINGGTVVASANPAADAGMDSDMGSYINGGTVLALGSTMDWAESDSNQVTMNLQFAQFQSSGTSIVISAQDGTVVFAYDPAMDEVLGENRRQYMGAIVSCPNLHVGQGYEVYMGAAISGQETGGVYDVLSVSGHTGGVQMCYTGTDVRMGGMGMMPGGEMEPPEGEIPEAGMPEGEIPEAGMPEGEIPEGDMQGGQPPEGDRPEGQRPGGNQGQGPGEIEGDPTEGNTVFFLQDEVNMFSGLAQAQ